MTAATKPRRTVKVVCYVSPMSRRSACARPGVTADQPAWSKVTCPNCLAKQTDLAIAFAHYCGTEFEANLPNARMRDYLDDCATKFGVVDWITLPPPQKHIVRDAFDAGRAAERKARKEGQP